MWNLLWILLGIGLVIWMVKKGGCCGMKEKPAEKEAADQEKSVHTGREESGMHSCH
jgi:hypothetical protein